MSVTVLRHICPWICKSHIKRNVVALNSKLNKTDLSIKRLMATNSDNSAKVKVNPQAQKFKYFLVLDFEATCDDGKKLDPQEIIEFPVLMVNSSTFETESTFHQYVQPTVHKELSPFCTELTGIMQDMVDGQKNLEEVMKDFQLWMKENKLGQEDNSYIFVTCGDWDLKSMLKRQCQYFNLPHDKCFKKWINIKKSFASVTSVYPKGMLDMLKILNIPHQGRHHSGIDDCKNIANILIELIKRGHMFSMTGQL